MIEPNSPSGVVCGFWQQKKFDLARSTEATIRAANPTLKLFSCSTEEVLAKFITNDPEMRSLKESVQLLQAEDDPVLIIGPTGTGKELIARGLHGSRSGKFVAINCTSLPDELLESELFGHVEGAFTGAKSMRVGKFRWAHNGTIFLDEIGDMPLSFQAKLLRVLQEKVVNPVGSDKEEPINCRIVAATNRSVDELLGGVHFREDLYWRLAGFVLKTKGLTDRVCDIEDIVDSLGGEKLVMEFEKWKTTIQATLIKEEINEGEMYSKFFNLQGNVRSLQAQVRRYNVLGKL